MRDTSQLHAVADYVAAGGRWYGGVRGSRTVARELHCSTQELGAISAIAWNLIAVEACATDVARDVYHIIVGQLREQMSDRGRKAAAVISKKFNLPKGMEIA